MSIDSLEISGRCKISTNLFFLIFFFYNNMEAIKITMPLSLKPDDVKWFFEGGLEKNSEYTCKVEFLKTELGENVYEISTDGGPQAFYLIGITAATCLTFLDKREHCS